MTTDTASSDPQTELIRRLGSSTFNYWFGYVANSLLVVWMVSHAFSGRHGLLTVPTFIALAAAGLFSWTLSEFLLHRYVYHVWSSFLSQGHALHHKRPRDLIGVPWYLTTVAVVLLFKLVTLVTARPAPTGVVMGFNWLGYIGYCVAHHGSHHWNLRRGWLGRMRRHHLLHHAHPEYNWGFTTSLWDHVFATHYDARSRPLGTAP